jgi:hypothetical protein
MCAPGRAARSASRNTIRCGSTCAHTLVKNHTLVLWKDVWHHISSLSSSRTTSPRSMKVRMILAWMIRKRYLTFWLNIRKGSSCLWSLRLRGIVPNISRASKSHEDCALSRIVSDMPLCFHIQTQFESAYADASVEPHYASLSTLR